MEELPKLPYGYNALEPYIDEQTMTIHHTKHHQAYIDKFNAAVKGTALEGKTAHETITNISNVPEDIKGAVRNNGGGHVNHSLFWQIMCPASESGKPSGELLEAIEETFGSLESFKEEFEKAALTRFGSGWAWLCIDNGKLVVESTQNQDTPLSSGKTPVLGLDMWEHSFYLKWKNQKDKYVEAWWNVVNWSKVSENYTNAL